MATRRKLPNVEPNDWRVIGVKYSATFSPGERMEMAPDVRFGSFCIAKPSMKKPAISNITKMTVFHTRFHLSKESLINSFQVGW